MKRLEVTELFFYSTPDRYVEIGGSKLNEVSYQLARAYCVPCKGVYVAEPSGSKLPQDTEIVGTRYLTIIFSFCLL